MLHFYRQGRAGANSCDAWHSPAPIRAGLVHCVKALPGARPPDLGINRLTLEPAELWKQVVAATSKHWIDTKAAAARGSQFRTTLSHLSASSVARMHLAASFDVASNAGWPVAIPSPGKRCGLAHFGWRLWGNKWPALGPHSPGGSHETAHGPEIPRPGIEPGSSA